jgi:RsmE family RNA methyltransferase
MNIVLFEPDEIDQILPWSDERAQHILKVLRRDVGDTFDAGIIDGPRGKGTLVAEGTDGLELKFSWGEAEPPLPPIDLIVGLSRPQTNRKILQEATALGVRSMSFVKTERGEDSYAKSRLWSTGEWRRHLVAGATQAFTTRLPTVNFGDDLELSVSQRPEGALSIVFDNYESPHDLSHHITEARQHREIVLSFGAERGWTAAERELFRREDFLFAHLGTRPLRTETAIIAAIAITSALMQPQE